MVAADVVVAVSGFVVGVLLVLLTRHYRRKRRDDNR